MLLLSLISYFDRSNDEFFLPFTGDRDACRSIEYRITTHRLSWRKRQRRCL